MKGGDLSNDLAPIVAIRFERLIKTEEGKLNKHMKGFIQKLIGRLDVNVYIITTGNARKCLAFLVKWGVPFSRVLQADSTLEVPDIVNENYVITYYDVDTDMIQNVNSRARKGVKAIQWTHREAL